MPHNFVSTAWTEVDRIGLGARKSSQPGMFSNAHNVNNPNATFQDVAGDVHYHKHTHAGEEKLEKKEEPFNKPELPTQRYSRLLMSEGRGYPLPDPKLPNELSEEHRIRGVMIGDVGTVTKDGYFEPFFNVCEPPNGSINESGIPEGFVQLEMPPSGPKHAHNYRRDTAYEPGAWVTNGDVEVTSHPLEPGNPSGTYEFECGFGDGAILVLPDGASREDLVNTEAFFQYASKHGVSWYKFANRRLGRRIPNGSIYFITGYDKTSTWGTASFACNSTMSKFRMHFNGTRWDQPGRASVKQVRKPREIEHGALPENQSTFLRGYKITLNSRILHKIRGITVAETSPIDEIPEEPNRQIPFGEGNNLTSIFRSVLGGRNSSTTPADSDNFESESTHTIITPTVPSLSVEIHPSSVINQCLLNQFPESDLAITHDSVWCSYLEMRKKSENQVSDSLLEYIKAKYTSVSKSGVVYLVDALAPANCTEFDTTMREEVKISPENANTPELKQGSLTFYPRPITVAKPISSNNTPSSPNDILYWTNQDPRESQLFNSWGVVYRFQTVFSPNGQSVTTLWRTIRPNKEDRAAKLEWSANEGLGRVVIDKKTMPMQDLVSPDAVVRNQRYFFGPDGFMYRWRPSTTSQDIVLVDGKNNVIALYRPTRPTRYQIGDVYGELHFLRTAGAGTVTYPPIMDYVTVSIMLYRFCAQWNL